MPQFTCNYVGQTSTFSCKESDFCGNPEIEYMFTPSPTSLYNWVGKLGLICRPEWQVGLLGSSLFMGMCCTLLWLPSFGGRYGRRKIFWIGNILALVVFTVLMISKSFWLSVAMIFLLGALESIRMSIGYNYCMELIGAPYRTFYGSIWNVNEGLVYLWATIYFWQIDKHWFPLVAFGYSICILSNICLYFFPESPPYLIKRGFIAKPKRTLSISLGLMAKNSNSTRTISQS
jgi:MFS family permease